MDISNLDKLVAAENVEEVGRWFDYYGWDIQTVEETFGETSSHARLYNEYLSDEIMRNRVYGEIESEWWSTK